jgi:hypothetical protein
MAYQGFKNQMTWLVYLWLTKEENTYNQMQVVASDARYEAKAFAQEIEALIRDFNNPLAGQNSLYTEILDAGFEAVDWEEIAATFLQENRS